MNPSPLHETTLHIAELFAAIAVDVQCEVAADQTAEVRKRIETACQSLNDKLPALYGWLEQRRPEQVAPLRERVRYVFEEARIRHRALIDSKSDLPRYQPSAFQLYDIGGSPPFEYVRCTFSELVGRLVSGLRCWTHDQIAEATPSGEPVLGDRARYALIVLLEQGAIDSDHRITTDIVAQKAIDKLSGANELKKVISDLKRAALVETGKGRTGGVWLTPKGKLRAEKI